MKINQVHIQMRNLILRRTQRQPGSHRPGAACAFGCRVSVLQNPALSNSLFFPLVAVVCLPWEQVTLLSLQVALGLVKSKVDISLYVAGGAVNWPHFPWVL